VSPYWCAECSFPAYIPFEPDPGPPDRFVCWACGGPVASGPQLWYWNNLAFKALLDERLRQLNAGESVELAGHPGVRFAVGAAADYLLLEALGREPGQLD
jgi:hypothetical protein